MKNSKKKGGIGKNKLTKFGVVLGVLALGVLIFLGYLLKDMPSPRKLATGDYSESSEVYDKNGKLLYEFYSDKRRTFVKLADVPKPVIQATIAVEDSNFYKNNGFDFKGILRGLFRTVVEGRLQGGSTITQQLVKNGLLTPERTWKRKVREAVLTVATDLTYSKDQILEMYFNQTPYGGTLWGINAAARGIFNKDLKDLDLAESALLAGLPASPTNYSPFTHPEAAKKRQEAVLKRMVDQGYITQKQMDEADKEQLNYALSKTNISAPHFVFYVKQQLIDKYGEDKVNMGGLKITTTLDSDIQNYVQQTVASEVGKLVKYNVTNGAAVVTEPKTGNILAMVGSKDYWAADIDGKYNVTTALRQPGSSIKPLNYAMGIETGKVTAASVFDDDPTCFTIENQKNYCPTNYGGGYHGIQTLRTSLGNSLNIPAVKMLKVNGVEPFIASASAMGISTFKDASNYGLSLTLGGGEVMMTDMATAFGVFANMGIKQPVRSIQKVTDRTGKTLEESQFVPGERVLSRETAFIIGNILSDDGARSMVFGSGSLLNIKKHPEVSVKTGTTNDLRDNWTIGFTQDFVTAVWVGNNDNTKMHGVVSGTTGAAPIWNKVMTYILKDKQVKKMPVPTDIVQTSVCNLTGQLPPDGGCDSHNEYFKKEFVPTDKTALQQNVLINKDTGRIVGVGDTNATNTEWQTHTVIKDAANVMVCLDCPNANIGTTAAAPYLIN